MRAPVERVGFVFRLPRHGFQKDARPLPDAERPSKLTVLPSFRNIPWSIRVLVHGAAALEPVAQGFERGIGVAAPAIAAEAPDMHIVAAMAVDALGGHFAVGQMALVAVHTHMRAR